VNTTSSLEELLGKLDSLIQEGDKVCIGIDGMDGIGKTPLARKLAPLLGAQVISLDDYLDKKQGAYIPHIRCNEVTAAIEAASARVIVEGGMPACRCGALRVHDQRAHLCPPGQQGERLVAR
jgi:dephospho-CoA kinase